VFGDCESLCAARNGTVGFEGTYADAWEELDESMCEGLHDAVRLCEE
jgi:hypothetical protein